jgi:hypothetical protein
VQADPSTGFGGTRMFRLTGARFEMSGGSFFEPPHLLGANNSANGVLLSANHRDEASGVTLGQFPVQDGSFVSPYGTAANSAGTWIGGGGDFTGDARLDVIIGTRLNELLIIR